MLDDDFALALVEKNILETVVSVFDDEEEEETKVYYLFIYFKIINFYKCKYILYKRMAAIVIGDINNLICAVKNNNLHGVDYAVDSLFSLYIV